MGLLVHGADTLLDSERVHLTLVDHATEGSLQLGLVGGGHYPEHRTALAVHESVAGDDTCEALDLGISLPVVLDDGGMKGSEALQEVGLGGAESISSVETGTTSGLSHLLVSGSLDLGIAHQSAVKAGGLLAEHTLSMATVPLHAALDGAQTLPEVVRKTHHLGVGGRTVLGHEATESLVIASKLHLTLVAKLDHTLDLGVHVAVHTSLLEAVLGDDTPH